MSFQQITIVGNSGQNAEVKTLSGDKKVANFSVAVNEGKDKPPMWLRVNAWNKLAELCGQYVTKGKQVLVIGKLQIREYEKDGQKRTSIEVLASEVRFLSKSETVALSEPQLLPPAGGEDDIPF